MSLDPCDLALRDRATSVLLAVIGLLRTPGSKLSVASTKALPGVPAVRGCNVDVRYRLAPCENWQETPTIRKVD